MFPVVDDTWAPRERTGRDIVFDAVEHFALAGPVAGRLVTSLLPLDDLGNSGAEHGPRHLAVGTEPDHLHRPLNGTIDVAGETSLASGTPRESLLLQPGYRQTRLRARDPAPFAAIAAIARAGCSGSTLPTACRFDPGAHAAADAMSGYLRYFAQACAPGTARCAAPRLCRRPVPCVVTYNKDRRRSGFNGCRPGQVERADEAVQAEAHARGGGDMKLHRRSNGSARVTFNVGCVVTYNRNGERSGSEGRHSRQVARPDKAARKRL